MMNQSYQEAVEEVMDEQYSLPNPNESHVNDVELQVYNQDAIHPIQQEEEDTLAFLSHEAQLSHDPNVTLSPEEYDNYQMTPQPTYNPNVPLESGAKGSNYRRKILLAAMFATVCLCGLIGLTPFIAIFYSAGPICNQSNAKFEFDTFVQKGDYANLQIEYIDDLQVRLYDGETIQVSVQTRWIGEKPCTKLFSTYEGVLRLITEGKTDCSKSSASVLIPRSISSKMTLFVYEAAGTVTVSDAVTRNLTTSRPSFETVQVRSTKSSISYEGIVVSKYCTATALDGDVNLSRVSCSSIDMYSHQGNFNMERVHSDNDITVYARNGNIRAKNLAANKEIKLQTYSGNVEAEVHSTVNVQAICQTGNIDLTLHNVTGTFIGYTDNGDVSMRNSGKSSLFFDKDTESYVHGYINNKSRHYVFVASTNKGDVKIRVD